MTNEKLPVNDYSAIQQIIGSSSKILIIQADNPYADSLASSLALESILDEMGKDAVMYCGVDVQNYLKYLEGWDRVTNQVPNQFDAAIIVDTSAKSLLEQLALSGAESWVAKRPVIVLDHHTGVECDIDYADEVINDDSMVSTGELIYNIAKKLNWSLPLSSLENIMTSILADSMGLTTANTSPETYLAMSELVKAGVNRPQLEEKRRAYNKMAEKIFRYKGRLIERTEIIDDKIAILVIPQDEINEYSPLYNPAPLIQPEHLQTDGIQISVVLKHYSNGRITAAIRSNLAAPIAGQLATQFGGGGHDYASGFKVNDLPLNQVKTDVINKIRQLID